MTNALTIRPLTAIDWQKYKDIDLTTFESRKYGITKGELAVKLGIAHELGLPPILAGLKGIQVINNVPTVAPKLAWALILRHPEFDGYEEIRLEDNKGQFLGYKITLRRKNSPVKEATRQFTLDDAKRITQGNKKLIDKENYQNYPENMCYWRAMGFVQDVIFADVTFGIPRADEMGAEITPDGDVIEGNWQVYTEQPKTDPLTLLLANYTPEQILAVCDNGVLPQTQEEITLVIERLEGQNDR